MSEECAAVCGNCNRGTTGKIYEPYWCADCKIQYLETQLAEFKESHASLLSGIKKAKEERLVFSEQCAEYKTAFEVLLRHVKNGR